MGAWTTWAAVVVVIGTSAGDQVPPPDRLYGRVVTAAGRVYEGYLRWDKNEGSWADVLHGTKELPWENLDDAERLDPGRGEVRRRRSLSLLGLRISWTEGGDPAPRSAASGVRFGHLRSLAVLGDHRALLTLKSGEELVLEEGSTDVGEGFRGLVVEDEARGEVRLGWKDLDVVEFLPTPVSAPLPPAWRLHGTLRTRAGDTFTGYVAWDVDEILSSDVLDGEDGEGTREVAFGDIAAIERAGSSAARVVLRDGVEVELRGSNDVNDGNRGIQISDPALGLVTVAWDDFEELVLHEPTQTAGYGAYDGGAPLYGEVETEEGDVWEGFLRWDNDEAWSWELLDGRLGDVDLDIEFAHVASVRRLGGWGAEVTLLDGRAFELIGSNDVDEGNKGIYVTLERGEKAMIPWWDVREVRFWRP